MNNALMSEPAPQDDPSDPPKPKVAELSEEFRNEVTQHINRKAVSPNDACPVCGSHFNVVDENVLQVPTRMVPDTIFSSSFVPVVTTVCLNCGFVRMFSENVIRGKLKQEQGELPLGASEAANGG